MLLHLRTLHFREEIPGTGVWIRGWWRTLEYRKRRTRWTRDLVDMEVAREARREPMAERLLVRQCVREWRHLQGVVPEHWTIRMEW